MLLVAALNKDFKRVFYGYAGHRSSAAGGSSRNAAADRSIYRRFIRNSRRLALSRGSLSNQRGELFSTPNA